MKNFDDFFLSNLQDLKSESEAKKRSFEHDSQNSSAQPNKVLTLADYKEQVKLQHKKPNLNTQKSNSPPKNLSLSNYQMYSQDFYSMDPSQMTDSSQMTNPIQMNNNFLQMKNNPLQMNNDSLQMNNNALQMNNPLQMNNNTFPMNINPNIINNHLQINTMNNLPQMNNNPMQMNNPQQMGSLQMNPANYMNSVQIPSQQYLYGTSNFYPMGQFPNNQLGFGQIILKLTQSEQDYYRRFYSTIQGREISGDLPAKNVVDFMKTSNLSKEKLKEFWRSLKKPDNNPSAKVTEQEFFILLKMIALSQMNIEPNIQNVLNTSYQNLPIFHNVEEEDAFESFQSAQPKSHEEEFTEFEHSSPMLAKPVEDLMEFGKDENKSNKNVDEGINIKASALLNYDRFNVFDEISAQRKIPEKHSPIKKTLKEENPQFPQENPQFFQENLQSTQENPQFSQKNTEFSNRNPQSTQFSLFSQQISNELFQQTPQDNNQNPPKTLDLYNPFTPDLQKKFKDNNSELKNFELEQPFESQEDEFQEFQEVKQNFDQNSQMNPKNTDEFQDFQGFSKDLSKDLQAINKKENFFQENNKEQILVNNQEDDLNKEKNMTNSDDFQKFQEFSEQKKEELIQEDFQEFQMFPQENKEDFLFFQEKNLKKNSDSDDFQEFQGIQDFPQKEQNPNNVIKGNVYETDWPEAEAEKIPAEKPQIKAKLETEAKKPEEFQWVEAKIEQNEKPIIFMSKKTDDLMEFDDEPEETNIKALLEGTNPQEIQENSNIKVLLEGIYPQEIQETSNIKALLEGTNFQETKIGTLNKDIFSFSEKNPQESIPKNFVFNFNEIGNKPINTNTDVNEDEFEWNEASAIQDVSPDKNPQNQSPDLKESDQKSASLPEKTNSEEFYAANKPQIVSKYHLQEPFTEQQPQETQIPQRNLLDLISIAEGLIPAIRISNFFNFSFSYEEISELEQDLFSLEFYEESEVLKKYLVTFQEICECEKKKKRLISEEKYEEVIGIRDRVKELEKHLISREKIQQILEIYQNAHGRSFSVECIEKLAGLHLAEGFIESFVGLIQKSIEEKELEMLKKIKIKKKAFV